MPYKLDDVKILIVDDMQPMLSLTKSILTIFGFKHIDLATSGEEAFELLVKNDPDLVITDWMMQPMDGLEFTEQIRRDKRAPNPYVPVIMMTGFSSRLRVEKARDVGITEFLMKPFTSRDLYNRITQIVEKPRQFVDAGTFFGPDRRRRHIRDYQGPKRRDRDKIEVEDGDIVESDILMRLRNEAKKL